MPAIEVSHLTKEYRLGAMQSMRKGVQQLGARLLGRPLEVQPPFRALDDVSFSIEPGEVVGVIGHNGAGKSTLLKMLARVSTPTKGSVNVRGRVAPLIEVGAGFVGDFTGRENIYLNAAILGMSRREIDRKLDEIIDFAELSQFIDTPIKRYSSGMQVKLGFAIATSVDAEVLIVDEVLSVGDIAFQRKSFDRMESLIRTKNRTVLLVSHNIRQVERICSRAILLDHGRIIQDGNATEVGNRYFEISDKRLIKQQNLSVSGIPSEWPDVELRRVRFNGSDHEPGDFVSRYGEPLEVVLYFYARKPIKSPTLGIGIHTPDLMYICNSDTDTQFRGGFIPEGEFEVRWSIPKVEVMPGAYALRVSVAEGEAFVYYAENQPRFLVSRSDVSRAYGNEKGFIELGARAELVLPISANSVSSSAARGIAMTSVSG